LSRDSRQPATSASGHVVDELAALDLRAHGGEVGR
jgi:hypothetical protein